MGMLVLERDRLQGFHIGDDIEVVVLGWDSKRVRIGIEAPRDVTILRNELMRKPEDKEPQEKPQ